MKLAFWLPFWLCFGIMVVYLLTKALAYLVAFGVIGFLGYVVFVALTQKPTV